MIEGTEGLARGTIGWPSYRTHTPSSLNFTTKRLGNDWIRPHWSEAWYLEAFRGTMGKLLQALNHDGSPANNGRDNLGTMALVDAVFRGVPEHRVVELPEIRGL